MQRLIHDSKYIYSLKFLIKNKWVAVGGLVLITAISVFLIKKHHPDLFLQKTRVCIICCKYSSGKFIGKNTPAKEIDKIVKRKMQQITFG
jgi:hypothetical protein